MKLRVTPPRSSTAALFALTGVAAVIAVAGLHAVFESWTFLWLAVAGAATAVGVAFAAEALRLLVGESIALGVLAFVVVGIIAAGGSPTPHGADLFLSGLIGGWADIVSATQPADLAGQIRVVPFALAWLGALIGCELARSTRAPSLPIVGPLVGLSLAVLLSAEDRNVALVQGALLATTALLMGAIQQRSTRRESELAGAEQAPTRTRRTWIGMASLAVLLVLVGVTAPMIGPRLPLADANERYDLRSQNTPPWNPLSVPSPLVQVKASLAEDHRDDVVFTVESETPIERWQTAVLGEYDGVVWTVGSGEGSSAASEFRPIDTRLPRAPSNVRDRDGVSATVHVVDLREPWLPSPGWPSSVDIAGEHGPIRANLKTGTLALVDGVDSRLTYEIDAYVAPTLTDGELSNAGVDTLPESDALDGLPPPVRNLAADLLEGKDVGWQQVTSIRDELQTSGFYDSTSRAAPGHSYFRLAEFLSDPDRIVGYEEQYAAAAAVMMRTAQLPARVVVGYRVPADRWRAGTAEVHAGDIAAWVEVDVQGHGWVPVDVTPDRTRTPTVDEQGTVFEDVAVPNPPPPPQLPPNIEVITDENNDEEPVDEPDEEDEQVVAAAGWGTGAIAVASGIGLLLLIGLVCGLIALVKHRRTLRRRRAPVPAHRVAGAWLDLEDRCREAGVPLPEQVTPLEAARTFLATEPSANAVRGDVLALVASVDRAAYHSEPPVTEHADEAWQYSDRVVDALVRDRSATQRLKMRLDPRTLRHRDPLSKSAAGTNTSRDG